MNHTISLAVSACIISAVLPRASDAAPDVDRVLPLPASGVVRINNVSGTLRVRPWAKSQVRLRAKSDPEVKAVVFGASKEGVEIRVELPSASVNGGRADLVVDVPAAAILAVRGVNLSVDIEQGREVDVATVNGAIVAREQTGKVRLKTVNGPITLQGGAVEPELDTVNGRLEVQVQRLLGLELRSVSGSVAVKAVEVAPAGHSIRVHSGRVDLELPASVRVKHRNMTERRVLGSTAKNAPTVDVRSFSSTLALKQGAE